MRPLSEHTTELILRAFRVLSARYNARRKTDDWNLSGVNAVINVHRLTPGEDAKFQKLMKAYWKESHYKQRFYRTDVVKEWPRIRTIQRTLNPSHFRFLLRHAHAWDDWPKRKRPVFVEYNGRVIIWNGTHRTIISHILNRKLLVRGINLDAFLRDKKAGTL